MRLPNLLRNLALFIYLFVPQLTHAEVVTEAVTTVPEFYTGINMPNFQICEKKATTSCNFTETDEEFKECLGRLPILQQCRQFNAFANIVNFGSHTEMDFFRPYNEVNIFLIHIHNKNSSYPGDFYFITRAGELIKATSPRIVDITKAPDYPAVAARYPSVKLYPITTEMPKIQRMPNSDFLFTFKFPLLDGCATCQLVGYAYVGLYFIYNGKFKDAQVISMTAL